MNRISQLDWLGEKTTPHYGQATLWVVLVCGTCLVSHSILTRPAEVPIGARAGPATVLSWLPDQVLLDERVRVASAVVFVVAAVLWSCCFLIPWSSWTAALAFTSTLALHHENSEQATHGYNLVNMMLIIYAMWYLVEDVNGKKIPRKVGMAPVQRDGLEYEFDVVGEMDWENKLIVTKSRCPQLAGGVFPKPGRELADELAKWLGQHDDHPPDDHKRKAARILELAEAAHGADVNDYLAAVLAKLGEKHRREFQNVGDVPAEEQERWLAKLRASSGAR